MIYNYPYFGFPNYLNYINRERQDRRNQFSSTYKPNIGNNKIQISKSPYLVNQNPNIRYKTTASNSESYNYPPNSEGSSKSLDNDYPVIFNIMGINLHFDDILLGFVILFLYNEKISDTYLLIALVLILLG